MKKFAFGVAAVALLALSAPAMAGDALQAKCVSTISADGTIPATVAADAIASGCTCMIEQAAGDDALTANLDAALDIAEFEPRMAALDPANDAAAKACFTLE